MTDTYSTTIALAARLSPGYVAPLDADAAKMLVKASELIDYATQGRAQFQWVNGDADVKQLLSDATCDQVEYWLEAGEEHDVLGLQGTLVAGRLQVQKLPPILGKRALRTLIRAGLYWAGSASF
jgi:hypothetical protein